MSWDINFFIYLPQEFVPWKIIIAENQSMIDVLSCAIKFELFQYSDAHSVNESMQDFFDQLRGILIGKCIAGIRKLAKLEC